MFPENVPVVNAPVVGVVAPTVPLILIDAVPVKLVTTPEVGVPKIGVTNVGDVLRTTEPVPVLVVTPVPPDATARVADRPAAVPDVFWFSVGKVQLAKLPDVGVPNIGVTNVGLVDNTLEPVPVLVVTPVPPDATARVADRPAAVPDVF